MDLDIVIFV